MENRLLTCHAGYVQRSFYTCDWKDNLGNEVIHERTYNHGMNLNERAPETPAQLHWLVTKEPNTVYWITQAIYTNTNICKQDSEKYGFVIQKSFYCDKDNPSYFPIFDDFDKAIFYLNDKLQGENFRYITE